MEYLPISKINTVVFCPRRYYIESVLRDTAENHHMTEGTTLHQRARRKGEGVWVWSDRLGISGIVDQLTREGERWVITELKKGYLGEHPSDRVQLCALAVCFEEMHDASLEYGFIYYHRTRRRLMVEFALELRQQVDDAVAQMRSLAEATSYPPVTDRPSKCRGCSVREACQPDLSRKRLSAWTGAEALRAAKG